MPTHQKSPEEVFTPRAPAINAPMYVHRPGLEQELADALRGSFNIIIHGESGTGKTWLYKRVLDDQGVVYETVDLAEASLLKSIVTAVQAVLDSKGIVEKTGYSETKSAGVNVTFLKGDLEHTGHYRQGGKGSLEACYEYIRRKAGTRRAVLVLENLDQIIDNPDLMKELADIIMLLDSDRYGRYGIKLLIISIPSSVKEYFARVKNLSAVSNRIREIPEVSRLEPEEAEKLIRMGMLDELKLEVDPLKKIIDHICWVTDRIPQRLHEYCLELAKIGRRNKGKIEWAMTSEADRKWVRQSLSANYHVIEKLLNDRETKIGRRSQCVYALGKWKKDEFKSSDIEAIIRKEFPATTSPGKSLNVGGILAELANKEDNPIIKRTPIGDTYAFKDPKYKMCIRAMLDKDQNGLVVKKDLGTI